MFSLFLLFILLILLHLGFVCAPFVFYKFCLIFSGLKVAFLFPNRIIIRNCTSSHRTVAQTCRLSLSKCNHFMFSVRTVHVLSFALRRLVELACACQLEWAFIERKSIFHECYLNFCLLSAFILRIHESIAHSMKNPANK